jgi:uncharacterized Zn finger protein (UPF0148 family)
MEQPNEFMGTFHCPVCGHDNEFGMEDFNAVGREVVEVMCERCETDIDVERTAKKAKPKRRKPKRRESRPLTEEDIRRELAKEGVELSDMKFDPNDSPEGEIVVHPSNRNVFNTRTVLAGEPSVKRPTATARVKSALVKAWGILNTNVTSLLRKKRDVA